MYRRSSAVATAVATVAVVLITCAACATSSGGGFDVARGAGQASGSLTDIDPGFTGSTAPEGTDGADITATPTVPIAPNAYINDSEAVDLPTASPACTSSAGSGFSISIPDGTSSGSPTAQAAVDAFVAHGDHPGYGTSDTHWVVATAAQSATFTGDGVILDVLKLTDGTWVVFAGQRCA